MNSSPTVQPTTVGDLKVIIASVLRIPKHCISDKTTIWDLVTTNGNLLVEQYDIIMQIEEKSSVEFEEAELDTLLHTPLSELPALLASKARV